MCFLKLDIYPYLLAGPALDTNAFMDWLNGSVTGSGLKGVDTMIWCLSLLHMSIHGSSCQNANFVRDTTEINQVVSNRQAKFIYRAQFVHKAIQSAHKAIQSAKDLWWAISCWLQPKESMSWGVCSSEGRAVAYQSEGRWVDSRLLRATCWSVFGQDTKPHVAYRCVHQVYKCVWMHCSVVCCVREWVNVAKCFE